MIRERIKTAQSRQKSYADNRRKPLEFDVGDEVILKISPVKGVRSDVDQAVKKRINAGPILVQVGPMAYRLALPPELERFHNVFYVSMLKKYVPDPSHILTTTSSLDLDSDLNYEEPEAIFDRKEHRLRNRIISYVKVKWKNHPEQEASWEREDEMKEKYR
ncbi:uncharacterized protein LOC122084813 [Macadamia integrifolia]|uniref:uncharacterized protein LOC122084813 n=1 Tax=Macadamia integrifolia TaxID=60698 RepID=UPI001C4F4580|nr:uncharacterized protein LOC122084813 [Macadamia integrifolia]